MDLDPQVTDEDRQQPRFSSYADSAIRGTKIIASLTTEEIRRALLQDPNELFQTIETAVVGGHRAGLGRGEAPGRTFRPERDHGFETVQA